MFVRAQVEERCCVCDVCLCDSAGGGAVLSV